MHEFGVTETIIRRLLKQLKHEKVSKVSRVHFRRNSAFSEEVLRQAFKMLSIYTPLEEAELVISVAVLHVSCSFCGHGDEVHSHDLVGHIFMCPNCGAIREISEAHDLELIEVIAETEGSPDGIQV
jgi:Zn finger protein HypA/HybF involved in hydrogenase expression